MPADDTVTTQDQTAAQTQLEALTTATQLISSFMTGSDLSIDNPEGGTIRTIAGINAAIDDALPGYATVEEAVTQANAAQLAAETAQAAAEAAANNAGAQAVSAIYKVASYTSASTVAIVPMNATLHQVTLTAVTTTLTIAGTTDPEQQARQIRIELTQGTGSNLVTWPSNVYWSYDREPKLSYEQGRVDIVDLITTDKGTTWRGAFNGGWYSA